jgi:hypothetical protein
MQMKWTLIGGFLVLIIGATAFGAWSASQPGEYDSFAQCISDSGAIFYGAFWCPHCQNQKRMFGKSADLLPYHECSTPDGRSQTAACNDAGVETYPTWVFADGSRLTGERQLTELAEKTNCTLPQS